MEKDNYNANVVNYSSYLPLEQQVIEEETMQKSSSISFQLFGKGSLLPKRMRADSNTSISHLFTECRSGLLRTLLRRGLGRLRLP